MTPSARTAAVRTVRRAVTGALSLLLLTALTALTAGPALAADNSRLGPQEGADTTGGLDLGQSLLVFVAAPLTILLVISAVVWLPGMVRSERYRPGKGWSAPPMWFAGPPEPLAAVEAAQSAPAALGVRGGASGNW